jgi:hypothetical protein
MSENERIAREILIDTCQTDEILNDYNMDLIEEGFIDSFAILNVILDIEKMTGFKLQVTEITKDDISSINKLIAFLNKIK